MRIEQSWVCPVCGESITRTAGNPEYDDGYTETTFTMYSVMEHHGPMGAACRWFFHSLIDEQEAILRQVVHNAAQYLIPPSGE